MKKLFGLLSLASLFVLSVHSALPEIPEECFDDETFCYSNTVVKIPEINKNVIRVQFFAKLQVDEYESEAEVLERFIGFNEWGEFTAFLSDYPNVKKALKNNGVVFVASELMDETVEYQGKQAIVHHAHYWTKGKFPVPNMEIVERALYFEIDTEPGALFTWKFVADPAYHNGDEIEFIENDYVTTIQGVQYKTGTLSLVYDEENEVYIAYVTVDVIPDIDYTFALHIGAKSVGNSLAAVFKGMFVD